MTTTFRLIAAAVILIMLGCTSVRPQTGDLSFRLLWRGAADLDLHVLDPESGHVGLPYLAASARDTARHQWVLDEMAAGRNPDGQSRGFLDIDCNADVERLCPRPIENIFWPHGQAPRGVYRVWVELFQSPTEEAVPFVVEIRRGEKVQERFEGSVSRATWRVPATEYSHEIASR